MLVECKYLEVLVIRTERDSERVRERERERDKTILVEMK